MSLADCGVGNMNPKIYHPEIRSPEYTSTRPILGDFVKVSHRDSAREICLNCRCSCWSFRIGSTNDKNFAAAVHRNSPTLARKGPKPLQIRLHCDCAELPRAWCEHDASEPAE